MLDQAAWGGGWPWGPPIGSTPATALQRITEPHASQWGSAHPRWYRVLCTVYVQPMTNGPPAICHLARTDAALGWMGRGPDGRALWMYMFSGGCVDGRGKGDT